MKHWPLYIILLVLVSACQQLRPLLQSSERGKYESSFSKGDSLFFMWKESHVHAMAAPLEIKLPYQATIQIRHHDASAVVYTAFVKQGQQLVAELQTQTDTTGIFLEFFHADANLSKKPLAELTDTASRISWSADTDDSVRISLQPRINDSTVYHLKVYTQPAYHFPVLGKGNTSIQSFWGADRDGGARRHEGIDIFAARGTPVLAVSAGRVGFAGERGRLGGKQVWLQENKLGFRVYYAHLDSIAVQSGEQVAKGDTLGFVGNTGNAAGGPPHLHFGVYGHGGAVDPLNFVKKVRIPVDREYDMSRQNTRTKSTVLRTGPGATYPELLQLQKDDPVKLLARTGDWLHVIVRDTVPGFIPKL